MTQHLKPYATYKDSGSRWLGPVPIDWDVRSLRTFISRRAERDRADLPLLTVARERGVFVRSLTDRDENHNVIPDDLSNYKVARSGDLVINKMKAWQGSMGIAPCDGIVSPAYFVFEFRIQNPTYGQRLLRSKPYVAHFAQASDGVRIGQWDLSPSGMRDIPVLVPSQGEQEAIVRFLDHANRQIDRFIRGKQSLIAVLAEQRDTVVQRAVSRGLDQGVAFKPSGVAWLGDIPQHWDVLRAKYVLREIDVRSTSGAEEQLSVSHLTGVTPRSEKNITMFKAESYIGHKICRPGDLVINTMWAWMAALGVSRHDGIVSPAYAVYRQRSPERMLPEFADLLLRTLPYKSNYITRSTGVRSSRLRLYPDEFLRIPLVLPPRAEQQQIVEWIASETQVPNLAIARTQREIALMQEYRTRLVADVVTGKVDVRGVAVPDDALFEGESPIVDDSDEPLDSDEMAFVGDSD